MAKQPIKKEVERIIYKDGGIPFRIERNGKQVKINA